MSRLSESRGHTVAFGHIGLQVMNLERSRAYYRDIIGLTEVEHQVRSDEYLRVVTGYPGVVLDIVVFEEPHSGALLELLEYQGVARTAVDPATANPGTGHVCFEVDDVDAIYRRALSAGERAVNEPITPTSGRWKDGRSVYLLDPDQIRVELVQRSPHMLAPTKAEIEEVFLVEASFAADAAETRKPYRARHLRRLSQLKQSGMLVEAGAYVDAMSTSILIVRAETAGEARQLVERDVYFAMGVWTAVTVRPFGRTVGAPDGEVRGSGVTEER